MLDELLPQAERLSVDVFVCDNASTDGTSSYLSEISKKYECLSYQVNDIKVDIDENMWRAMSGKSSSYIYPLGDDDFVPLNALARIIDELHHYPDLLVLNCHMSDIDFNVYENSLTSDLLGAAFNDNHTAFIQLWSKLQFGSFVLKNKIDRGNFGKYLGTSHAYAGIVWELLAAECKNEGKCKIKCMSDITVYLRNAGKTWKKDSARVFLYGIPKWLENLPSDYADQVASIKHEYLEKNGKAEVLLRYRKNGQLNINNYKKYLSSFPVEVQHKALIIVLLPGFVARLISSFLKKIKLFSKTPKNLQVS